MSSFRAPGDRAGESADDTGDGSSLAGPARDGGVGARPGRVRRAARAVFVDVTPLKAHPAYRRLWFGQTLATFGQQMTSLAIAVQVFALTGSSFAVGLVGLFVLVPVVALGLVGGATADSTDRRRIGLRASSAMLVLVLLLAGLAHLHVAQVWLLYLVVFLHAACWAISNPAQAAIIPRVVSRSQLPAANALTSLGLTVGLTAGPLLGGATVSAGGVQAAYLVDATASATSLYALWRLPALPPERAAARNTAAQRVSVREGLRFLHGRPNLHATFVIQASSMVLGLPRALFPAVAVAWYHGGSTTIGMLTSSLALGSFSGALCSGWLQRVRRQGRAIVLGAMAWGAAIAAFGLGAPLWLGMLLLGAAGFADTVGAVYRTTMLQVTTPDELRGRLFGILVVVGVGGPRLGDLRCGAIAAITTERAAIISGGLACVTAAVMLTLARPSLWKYDTEAPRA